jgi:hypothetical protein
MVHSKGKGVRLVRFLSTRTPARKDVMTGKLIPGAVFVDDGVAHCQILQNIIRIQNLRIKIQRAERPQD